MKIYGIADLHLSLTADKPMDIYGGQWIGHMDKLGRKWNAIVQPEDVVILAGDHSWGLKLEDATMDLQWISALPGQKVLIKGNHDLWWSAISKLNDSFETLYFLQNTSFQAGEFTICGTRGWTCPGDVLYTAHDQKIYERELIRLRMSLESAKKSGASRIIGAIHFPPTNDNQEESGFTKLFEEYGVELVVYGHLHGQEAHLKGFQGLRNGVEYRLIACDYLSCCPLLLTR